MLDIDTDNRMEIGKLENDLDVLAYSLGLS